MFPLNLAASICNGQTNSTSATNTASMPTYHGNSTTPTSELIPSQLSQHRVNSA